MKKHATRRLAALLLTLVLVLCTSALVFAAPAKTLKLRAPQTGANAPFAVENMFPGDSVTQDYTVNVNHKKSIVLYHTITVQPGYEKLAEVLQVRVELPAKGVTLYDGLMRDMPTAVEQTLAPDEKTALYRITAYLDTSVGNDYMYQSLLADFIWWYAEEPVESPPTVVPPVTPTPDTGDRTNIGLYIGLLVVCLAAAFILLFVAKRKKKEDDPNE